MLGLSESLCTKIARESLPEISQPILEEVTVGLARQPIPIASRIGCSALKLDEVAELAVGDVVLLDRPIADLFDLVVAGKETPHKCSLNQRDDRTILCVAASKPIEGE